MSDTQKSKLAREIAEAILNAYERDEIVLEIDPLASLIESKLQSQWTRVTANETTWPKKDDRVIVRIERLGVDFARREGRFWFNDDWDYDVLISEGDLWMPESFLPSAPATKEGEK